VTCLTVIIGLQELSNFGDKGYFVEAKSLRFVGCGGTNGYYLKEYPSFQEKLQAFLNIM